MGRPREHGDETREELLRVAERIAAEEGVDAVTVRRLADEVDTTTRAVYSLFGSKEGLLIALGARAFEVLGANLTSQRLSGDPVRDLAIAGLAFRKFALEHPALMRIGIQRELPHPELFQDFAAAADAAFSSLMARVAAFAEAGYMSPRNVRRAATQYHALCEGLAAIELRGALVNARDVEALWKDGLARLVEGLKE